MLKHLLLKYLLVTLLLGSSVSLALAQEVDFGYVEWPEAVMKTQVVADVLEALGYETTMQSLSVPLVLKGVSTGDLDVFLETWLPSMESMVRPYLNDGSITMSAHNLDGTLYRAAVPTYVYEAGVTSIADLDAHADRFGNEYYGIEPGNDGNEIMRKAIEADTYGLSDWQLVESSEQGMLQMVERATQKGDWIVFSGWRPHWMNNVFDISYLDDPENIWGGEGFVATVANTEFLEENPNLARFFEQFAVSLETQGDWIDQYGRQGRDPEEVAQEWIAANLATVKSWAEGVTTVAGDPAAAALEATFGDVAASN
jgi:glycine betaine/proline transport system substrate-binding protein